ncbi:MAG: hypothetical protein WC685_15310 [Methylobacter sp.]
MLSIMLTSHTDIGHIAITDTSLTDIGHMTIMDTGLTDIDPMAIIDLGLTEISVGIAVITGAEVMKEAETVILAVGGKAGEAVMAVVKADTAGINYCGGVRGRLTWMFYCPQLLNKLGVSRTSIQACDYRMYFGIFFEFSLLLSTALKVRLFFMPDISKLKYRNGLLVYPS